MGGSAVILLRSHGMVVAAPNLMTATVLALYLEENARRQCEAARIGNAYVLSDEEVLACRANLDKPNLFGKAWDYFRAKLDRCGREALIKTTAEWLPKRPRLPASPKPA